MNRVKRVSFVVRVIQDRGSEVCGVIERVAAGAKVRAMDASSI